MKRILLILILILLVLWIFNRSSTEAFDDFFNPVNNLIAIANPPVVSSAALQLATQGVVTKSQPYLANTYQQPNPEEEGGQTVQVGALASQSPDMKIAQTVCEPITTSDCSAFDNSEFNKNCGISFDVESGYSSKGKPHVGGLYIDPAIKAVKNNTGIYQPTYGGSNLFAKDKATCNYMRDDINCKKHINPIGKENCSMCFSDGSLHATDPNSDPVNLSFVFYTNAAVLTLSIGEQKSYLLKGRVQNQTIAANVKQDTTIISVNGLQLTTTTITAVPVKEGQTIMIRAEGTPDMSISLAGYFQASTLSGEYKMDLNAIIDQDLYQTPNLGGDVNGYMLFNQIIDNNPVILLTGLMPFTFKGIATHDSQNCTNGPFMTKKASVDYIATNEPCYGSEATPGNYKLECLQQLFLGAGGTQKGTGYPGTPETAKALLVDEKGAARTLSQIGQMLYSRMVTTSTGLKDGESVSIEEWDNTSMFMTGVHKAGPCDTKAGRPLSTACLISLYKAAGGFPKGKLNPDPAFKNPLTKDVAAAMTKGDKDAVSQIYLNAFKTTQNSSLTNLARQPAFLDAYGVPLLQSATMNLAAYVSVNGPDWMQMSQIVVRDNNGVNVAKGGNTGGTTGGVLAYGEATPDTAVDGVEAERYHPQIYHSGQGNNPWFIVQLTKPSIISEIIYYGRLDDNRQRNQKYIKIYNKDGDILWESPRMSRDNIQRFAIPTSVFQNPPPKLAGRVSFGGSDWINMSQLVVKDTNGVNVARGGDTSSSASGTYQNAGGYPSPAVAVDGTEAPRYHPQIHHSANNNGLFMVKLTKPSIITQIKYYGRLACCPERHAQTIKIYDNITGKVLWTSPQMTQAVEQTFDIPASVFK
jgi:hypothetical protein